MEAPTMVSVADDLSEELARDGTSAIDEWLAARNIDRLEMHDFIEHFGGGGIADGAVGFAFQVGYELATRKHAADLPEIEG